MTVMIVSFYQKRIQSLTRYSRKLSSKIRWYALIEWADGTVTRVAVPTKTALAMGAKVLKRKHRYNAEKLR